jgi:hypothetical protein
MQPANVAVFKRLKEGWKKAVLNFRRENPDKVLTKEKFAPVLKTLVDNVKPETDQNDFRASGLYPWNPAAIDYSKCTVKNYKEKSNDENSRNVNVVTFKTFRKIIGEEKIEMFKNFSEDAIHTEDLLTLFHLYDKFSKTKTSKKAQTMTEDLLNENFDLNGIIEHANLNSEHAQSMIPETVDNIDNESEFMDIENLPIIIEERSKHAYHFIRLK